MADQAERVAVVTGGARGIGLACAKALLASGHRVAIFSEIAEQVARARAELVSIGPEGNVLALEADLRAPDSIDRFFDQLHDTWGPASILVCNAGFSPKGPDGRRRIFHTVSEAEWRDTWEVNFMGAVRCCRHAAPPMAQAGFGRIVLIGSIAARVMPRVAGAGYATSKAAMAGLLRALVLDYSASGVTTNLVAPGSILTDLVGPPDAPKNLAARDRVPAGRLGLPEDVAALVAFLASEPAAFINGATIDINGGEYLPT